MSLVKVHTDVIVHTFRTSGRWYSSTRTAWTLPWVTNDDGVAYTPYTVDVIDYYRALERTPGHVGKWDGPVMIEILGDHPPILLMAGR